MDIRPAHPIRILYGMPELGWNVLMLPAEDAVHHGPRQAMEIMLGGGYEMLLCGSCIYIYLSVQASYSSSVREDSATIYKLYILINRESISTWRSRVV